MDHRMIPQGTNPAPTGWKDDHWADAPVHDDRDLREKVSLLECEVGTQANQIDRLFRTVLDLTFAVQSLQGQVDKLQHPEEDEDC